MRKALQLAWLFLTLVIVIYIGRILDVAYWQSGIQLERTFGAAPVPPVFQVALWSFNFNEFFYKNHQLIPSVLVLPWLLMIVLGVFSRRSFFNLVDFALRFVMFVLVEVFVVLFLVVSLIGPHFPYVAGLRESKESVVDTWLGVVIWGIVIVSLFGVAFQRGRRWIRRQSSKGGGNKTLFT